MKQKREFAVAVRDGADLFLYLTICRAAAGDVYVNWPRDYKANWKPHTSYHASGQHHHKSYDHKALVRHRQRPDAGFSGTVNVVRTGIASDEPRAINLPVEKADYEDVFEIPHGDLKPEMYRTFLQVDICEPNGGPVVTPGEKVLLQTAFQDAVPWILVTLFDAGPLKDRGGLAKRSA